MTERLHGSSTIWLTCDEVTFIQHLGMHTEQGIKTPRLIYLQRYLDGARIRQDWGKIDKVVVIQEAETLLRAEQRKAQKVKAA